MSHGSGRDVLGYDHVHGDEKFKQRLTSESLDDGGIILVIYLLLDIIGQCFPNTTRRAPFLAMFLSHAAPRFGKSFRVLIPLSNGIMVETRTRILSDLWLFQRGEREVVCLKLIIIGHSSLFIYAYAMLSRRLFHKFEARNSRFLPNLGIEKHLDLPATRNMNIERPPTFPPLDKGGCCRKFKTT